MKNQTRHSLLALSRSLPNLLRSCQPNKPSPTLSHFFARRKRDPHVTHPSRRASRRAQIRRLSTRRKKRQTAHLSSFNSIFFLILFLTDSHCVAVILPCIAHPLPTESPLSDPRPSRPRPAAAMGPRKRSRSEAIDAPEAQATEEPGLLQRIRSSWEFANIMQYIHIFGKIMKIDEEFGIEVCGAVVSLP